MKRLEKHEIRRALAEAIFEPPPPPPAPGDRICRECGCWDWNACVDAHDGPCWWVEEDLCSVCAARLQAMADPAYAGLYAEDGP
ncbi:MAG: hypothetical protein F4Y03_04560 [Alphaproteobacteria bacterium]|nr:hypothetical protein [Alphaproteobacteria bacterium]